MSPKDKNKPLHRRREEKAPHPAAEIGKSSAEALVFTRAANQSFGPWDWLFAAALVVAVFLVYQPVWQGGFVWDDDATLLNNPVLKPGGLAKVWVPGGYLNYWPFTYTAYWLEFKTWGLAPLGFHLMNIAVHAISALLVWRILVQLRVPGAMFATAIFALHPVNVESVAWIAQLKGLLALLLALVSVLFFLAHERLGGWWRLALAVAAFGLSTLAKGMLITLPVVLLACAWWQRGRIQRQDLLRVLPYLLIGAVMTSIEVWMQHLVGAGTAVRSDSLLSRTAVAGCAVWFYLGKLIWPLNLCFVYPRWQIDDRVLLFYVPSLLLVLVLGLAWWRRRTWGRPIVMLVVAYVALLLPALGFVNVYFMRYSLVADHYQYAAMIVPCAVFAGVAATLARRWIGHAPAGCVLCLVLVAVLSVLTWQQSRTYADAETLYRTTIDRNPDCWFVQNNLASVLAARGQFDEAIALYRQSLRIHPDEAETHYNLAHDLAACGQVDEAIVQYRQALGVQPQDADIHYNLANILAARRQFDEAIVHYDRSLQIRPDYAQAHNNFGQALAARGQINEAMIHYRKALEIQSDLPAAHVNLANALAGLGQLDDAITHYRKALEIQPDLVEAHDNLGNVLAARGQVDEASAHYRTALEINPDFAEAQVNFGNVLAAHGQVDEAMRHFRKALALASARNDTALADIIRARIKFHQGVAPAGNAP